MAVFPRRYIFTPIILCYIALTELVEKRAISDGAADLVGENTLGPGCGLGRRSEHWGFGRQWKRGHNRRSCFIVPKTPQSVKGFGGRVLSQSSD